MTLSRQKLKKESEKLFPKMTFYGRSAMDPDGAVPDPIPISEFLKRVQGHFPRVPLKKLFISFTDFELSVTHVTEEAQAKERALYKGNMRVSSSVNVTQKAHDVLDEVRRALFSDVEGLSVGEWIGNLVESRIKMLKPEIVRKVDLSVPGSHLFDIAIPEKTYNELRFFAHTHQISRSAIVSCILEEWSRERGSVKTSA